MSDMPDAVKSRPRDGPSDLFGGQGPKYDEDKVSPEARQSGGISAIENGGKQAKKGCRRSWLGKIGPKG